MKTPLPIAFAAIFIASLGLSAFTMQDPVKEPVKGGPKGVAAAVKKAANRAKRLPAARRNMIATAASTAPKMQLKVGDVDSRGLMSAAPATDSEATIQFFVADRALRASLGYGILKNSFVADQIAPLAGIYSGTKLEQRINDAVTALKAGGEDAKKMQAELDFIHAATEYGAGQKGAESKTNYGIGDSVAMAFIVACIIDDKDMHDSAVKLMAKAQENVTTFVNGAPSDFDASLKSAAMDFAKAPANDQASILKSIGAIYTVYGKVMG